MEERLQLWEFEWPMSANYWVSMSKFSIYKFTDELTPRRWAKSGPPRRANLLRSRWLPTKVWLKTGKSGLDACFSICEFLCSNSLSAPLLSRTLEIVAQKFKGRLGCVTGVSKDLILFAACEVDSGESRCKGTERRRFFEGPAGWTACMSVESILQRSDMDSTFLGDCCLPAAQCGEDVGNPLRQSEKDLMTDLKRLTVA